MAEKINIDIEQGSFLNLKVIAKDPNNNIVNLSGFDVRSQLKCTYGATGELASFNVQVDSGQLESGLINMSLTAAQTAALPVTRGVYDVEIFSGDFALKVLQGKAFIQPEVTT